MCVCVCVRDFLHNVYIVIPLFRILWNELRHAEFHPIHQNPSTPSSFLYFLFIFICFFSFFFFHCNRNQHKIPLCTYTTVLPSHFTILRLMPHAVDTKAHVHHAQVYTAKLLEVHREKRINFITSWHFSTKFHSHYIAVLLLHYCFAGHCTKFNTLNDNINKWTCRAITAAVKLLIL